MTLEQKIKQMETEQLADYLEQVSDNLGCPLGVRCSHPMEEQNVCYKCWKDELEREVV